MIIYRQEIASPLSSTHIRFVSEAAVRKRNQNTHRPARHALNSLDISQRWTEKPQQADAGLWTLLQLWQTPSGMASGDPVTHTKKLTEREKILQIEQILLYEIHCHTYHTHVLLHQLFTYQIHAKYGDVGVALP